ncbi:DUF4407 domain-containing protein [Acrocarpospora catenulata]|uniref:DUF4407 domain-containing protein n=1 Tax=Acrocarpospora catenulata TaxID=2836182 RepID=UPI001BDB2CE3|nr:DUF4407 domain-containing protein [Acrocarpospora catenulata]
MRHMETGRVNRFLVWAGGAAMRHIVTPLELMRAVAVGTMVMIVAVLAAVSMSIYLTVIIGGFHPWFIPLALFWGLIMLSVDRLILLDPSYPTGRPETKATDELTGSAPAQTGERSKRVARGTQWLVAYAIRIGIAMITAVFISEAISLVIFQPEIKLVLQQQADTKQEAETKRLVNQEIKVHQDAIPPLEKRIATYQTEIDDALARWEKAQQSYKDEINNPDRPGFGPLAGREADKEAEAKQDYEDIRDKNHELIKTLNDEIKDHRAQADHLNSPADPARKPMEEEARARFPEETGWLAQENAFQTFQRTNAGNPAVIWIPWLLRGLLFLVDLLPIVMKLISGRTLHAGLVRAEAARIQTTIRLNEIADHESLDLATAKRVRRDQQAAQLAKERDARYRDMRTDHLRRDGP